MPEPTQLRSSGSDGCGRSNGWASPSRPVPRAGVEARRSRQRLRELGERGDIIKRLHKTMSADGRRARDHQPWRSARREPPTDHRPSHRARPRRRAEGTAFAVVDGIDGRVHHLKLPRHRDRPATGRSAALWSCGVRGCEGPAAHRAGGPLGSRHRPAGGGGRGDLARPAAGRPRTGRSSGAGFGAEVRDALDRRIDHLAEQGLARATGTEVVFARDLIGTLRGRELEGAGGGSRPETGLAHSARRRRRACRGRLSPAGRRSLPAASR